MGFHTHRTYVFTSFCDEIKELHKFAQQTYKKKGLDHIITPVRGAMNGLHSFAILPEGSKEGWETSQDSTECAALVIKKCESYGERDEDDGEWHPWIDYVAVAFGGDHGHDYEEFICSLDLGQ